MSDFQQTTAPQHRIEADLARLEAALRELKVKYDMFFVGALKLQPLELRGEVDRIIKRHLNSPIPKYANRFHFNALVSRYNSLSELWGKTLRSVEEGDRRTRHSEDSAVREQLIARCRVQDPRNDHETMQALYRRFQDAHRKKGQEKPTLSFDKFVRGVSNQTRSLQERSGCGEIELRLVVSNDKVQLKARPRR